MTAIGKAALSAQPPTFCCLLPNGELCVTQEPSHQLLCLTLSGELRNVVDAEGSLLSFPTGIACDGESLFVTDGMRDRVHKLSIAHGFKPVGCSLRGDGGGARLHYPHGGCLHATGGGGSLLFVADWGNHRIVALDANSPHLAQRYAFGKKGRAPGQLMYPRGVASLSDDTLLVADTDNNRLQLVDAAGSFLRCIGGVEQPYAAVGAPSGGLAFVATMGGRLCIMPLAGRSDAEGCDGGGGLGGGGGGSGPASPSRLNSIHAKELAMPSAGRILCGLCSDGRRVLVAGVDEDRQLHLLAARGGGSRDGASGAAARERDAGLGGLSGGGSSFGGSGGIFGGSGAFDFGGMSGGARGGALASADSNVDALGSRVQNVLTLEDPASPTRGAGGTFGPSDCALDLSDDAGGLNLGGLSRSASGRRVGSARAGRRAGVGALPPTAESHADLF